MKNIIIVPKEKTKLKHNPSRIYRTSHCFSLDGIFEEFTQTINLRCFKKAIMVELIARISALKLTKSQSQDDKSTELIR